MVIAVQLTPAEALVLGLKHAGYTQKRMANMKANLRRFYDHYGIGPDSFSELLVDLQTTNLAAALVQQPKPRCMSMSLYWLKGCPTVPRVASKSKVDESTVTFWVWEYVVAIASLRAEKVSSLVSSSRCCHPLLPPAAASLTLFAFPQIIWRWTPGHNDNSVFIISVDGTHCPIQEPRTDPGPHWFSHKLHRAGLAYELAVSIDDGHLVWINGPFPASTHDLTIFRLPGGLQSIMPAGKKGIADRGYSNEASLSTRNPLDATPLREFKNRSRARHETFNGRIKDFSVLTQAFRHGGNDLFGRHGSVFDACCVLIQYEIENGHPLFDV